MRTDVSPTEFLKIASHTAEHFGFRTIESLRKHPACNECLIELTHNITEEEANDDVDGRITKGLSTYCLEKLHAIEGPILLYSLDTRDEPSIVFHIFNVQKSIAEAILIQANRALATELGHTEHTVHINSLGDSESMVRYSRELALFLRKRLDLLPTEAREQLKKHAFHTLRHLITTDHELSYRTPNPLEFLSDTSRKHFRDIIEFFDMTDTPYEINPRLISNHEYYSDALFKIEIATTDNTPAPLHIQGGRFDDFVFRKTKKKTSAVGSVAILKNHTSPSRLPRTKLGVPSVYIIQLGFGPKVRSLLLIDELRRAGIMVWQDLANDSLSAQLRDAENKLVSHVIIIGQKEYVDGTAIVRDMQARKQEAVPFNQLTKRIKRAAEQKVA
ncbi:MAG: His/Gly/Thr/Pro-type tRNA ligase C-terminal domain-containing protein [Candidatus Paceibacteria bacterium]